MLLYICIVFGMRCWWTVGLQLGRYEAVKSGDRVYFALPKRLRKVTQMKGIGRHAVRCVELPGSVTV